MGMHSYTTIGFAIVAKNCTLNSNTTYKRCSNTKCENHTAQHMSTPFCPKCGSKVENYQAPIDTDVWEVMEHLEIDDNKFETHYGDEIVGDDNTHLYFMGKKIDFDEYGGDEPKEIELEKLLVYKVKLMEKYAKEIEQLKTVYKSVEIKYLALNYWA